MRARMIAAFVLGIGVGAAGIGFALWSTGTLQTAYAPPWKRPLAPQTAPAPAVRRSCRRRGPAQTDKRFGFSGTRNTAAARAASAYQDLRRTGEFKSAGNDVSSIVRKYVPVGTSFADAAAILRSCGFDIDPLPPREPPKNPSPFWSGEHELMMRFAIFGTLVLAQQGVARITVEITLLPKILGADHNTVRGVHAAIHYRGV